MNLIEQWINAKRAEQESRVGSDAWKEKQLAESANSSGGFAGQGEAGYGSMTGALDSQRQFLNDQMSGKISLSGEQLRQGLQQQLAMQRSMAASASPGNAAMAARTAMMNANRAATGMSGNAATAGLQERMAAAQQLANMNLQQRGQDIQVGLGGRQNQMTGLGVNKPEAPKTPGMFDRALMAGATIAPLFSDERLKTDVQDGDGAAKKALDTLSAHTYRYKDSKYGSGDQLGVMAQALEKAGLRQAVIDTPQGKAVDHAKLTGANTAMLAALAKRLSKLEKK